MELMNIEKKMKFRADDVDCFDEVSDYSRVNSVDLTKLTRLLRGHVLSQDVGGVPRLLERGHAPFYNLNVSVHSHVLH